MAAIDIQIDTKHDFPTKGKSLPNNTKCSANTKPYHFLMHSYLKEYFDCQKKKLIAIVIPIIATNDSIVYLASASKSSSV
jgi:hypothetical protein